MHVLTYAFRKVLHSPIKTFISVRCIVNIDINQPLCHYLPRHVTLYIYVSFMHIDVSVAGNLARVV